MFGRSKEPLTPSPALTEAAPTPDAPAGKGRPTPKRKQAEAANKRPLVPDDRRAAAKAARAAQREQRDREYRAMQTGDERFMPAKDRGPVRRYVRDWVDARWSLGELFLPVAAVALVAQFALAQAAPLFAFYVIVALYLYVLAAIVDGWLLWRGLKKRLVAKFGTQAVIKGTAMYAVLRAFQIRPSRMPKPQVKHGQKPA
ncbi:DUF3043 domain-containing protein [Cellulomonas fimi]|uniref:Integral membrane protein n=1 Tax=Cellulomonas fimi (strain ATCC 484 / DSM 20113 / JCM 1341 / CCUG 24087 / LMG 16345 / NBRC 15513 / NCIMB 8980 / NCTC 7547 / NRS-133) TaxID=590998 RepID=F4H1M8_CELFA|nr:DUF3043 domain-containing protein [Cellulomonas fimi]AEE46327.1 hypothetical protein Celf_2199 [Cellulomonas fimi ATCC 484]NNH08483.1 DUF3043 domain-containing protein [Cellulomonas fimi]VEH32542.1 Protein of uncharacterised function (DUF3043) [Cellulomonas fimi]